MDKLQTEEIICNMLKEIMSVDDVQVDSFLIDDIGMGSMEILSFIGDLEEKFDIEIPEEDLKQFVQVKDIVDYINKK